MTEGCHSGAKYCEEYTLFFKKNRLYYFNTFDKKTQENYNRI